MQDSEDVPANVALGNEAMLLWLVAGLALVFLGVLIFDLFRRRGRAHRKRTRHRQPNERQGVWKILFKPVQGVKDLRNDLEEMLHKRSRRKRRRRHPPPEAPSNSSG